VGHRIHHAEADRRAAGDRRRRAKEFAARDPMGVELLGELANPSVHALLHRRH
jgi:hypothetical protein